MKTKKELQAEIEYQRQNGSKIWVHSDIEPKGWDFYQIDAEYREHLHALLDEWLDKSGGTGCFYIKDKSFVIEQQDNE